MQDEGCVVIIIIIITIWSRLKFILSHTQNQEMLTEGDLANSADQSNRVREMQDKIASLRAQVGLKSSLVWGIRGCPPNQALPCSGTNH